MIKKMTGGYTVSESEIRKTFEIPAELDEAAINVYPWDTCGYRPQSGAFLGWDETGIHVWLYSLESSPRAEVGVFGGPVCHDSCLEFFFQPNPVRSGLYVNYECSPKPCVHLATGSSRYDRKIPDKLPEGLEPSAKVIPGYGWSVHYTITAAWLKESFGIHLTSGCRMRGNFFKCGDLTENPHYGVWSPVDPQLHPNPDFHLSEYFSDLLFE